MYLLIFIVIRSHSRTCRRYLQVSVSAWSQVSACRFSACRPAAAAAARELLRF
ncbi:hypothetical protein [Methanimicrococcus hongohii]|uniref:hypothetical protein n=1 Tax=Methanimicrococcus hongohii TaxID=3028295 RepID=UPI0029307B03|nr:hypothetical protein [Methanimicrococcus sp. Hf6]